MDFKNINDIKISKDKELPNGIVFGEYIEMPEPEETDFIQPVRITHSR